MWLYPLLGLKKVTGFYIRAHYWASRYFERELVERASEPLTFYPFDQFFFPLLFFLIKKISGSPEPAAP